MTDVELLKRFAVTRDGRERFLVARHAARVRGVCRQVLLDEHEAEDALQATFLVLADKALVLQSESSLGGWLSAVAFRQALHARSARQRRVPPCGLIAGEAAEPVAGEVDPCVEVARRELGVMVREEIAALPEECRAPVVLCYLEGKTNEEAARELNWPSGSMSRRLEKARRLLKAKFVGRGLAMLAVLIGVGVLLGLHQLGRSEPPLCAAAGRLSVEARRDADSLLEQLVKGMSSRDERMRVARAASADADRLQARDQGAEWQRLTREMGAAARDLARENDADLRPANRLALACLQCHHAFRDN